MKIAIVHDWFSLFGGAEKVVGELLEIYPDAEIFSLLDKMTKGERALIKNKNVHTSRWNNAPFIEKYYRALIPIWMREIERFDLSKFDLIISSSAAFSKGVITGPDQLHISYIHSPPRYAWDLTHQYLQAKNIERGIIGAPIREMLHKLRIWDAGAGLRPDELIANSHYIARRINKTYRRKATIIYPPVDIKKFIFSDAPRKGYFLTAGRFVPYKRTDLIVRAFAQRPNQKLIVAGSGPDEAKLKKIATPNITFVSKPTDAKLVSMMQGAKAFIYAAEEDFGIVPVEAQACGTPVIALGKAGTRETVQGDILKQSPTGVWFNSQTESELLSSLDKFQSNIERFTHQNCRNKAEAFSADKFRKNFAEFAIQKWASKNSQ